MNGSMTAFLLSLVVTLSIVSFFIDIDIFRFSPELLLYPFLPFPPGGHRRCRGRNHPRWCLQATWTFIVCPRQFLSSARALGPDVKWARASGPGPQIIRPHNSPSKSCCPTSWSGKRVLAMSGPYHGWPNFVLH